MSNAHTEMLEALLGVKDYVYAIREHDKAQREGSDRKIVFHYANIIKHQDQIRAAIAKAQERV